VGGRRSSFAQNKIEYGIFAGITVQRADGQDLMAGAAVLQLLRPLGSFIILGLLGLHHIDGISAAKGNGLEVLSCFAWSFFFCEREGMDGRDGITSDMSTLRVVNSSFFLLIC